MKEETKIKIIEIFKFRGLTNFPFIESTFDALNEYQLLSKIVEFLNSVIEQQNIVGDEMVKLTEAYNTLKDYVDNYFENLDVQVEINNKLDDMVESGELQRLLDLQYTELKQIVQDEINEQDLKISIQNNKISDVEIKVNSLANINPIVVSSIEEMLDTTKIYVNTSDGNWYYYNNTWTVGGLYQSSGIADNSITKNKNVYFKRTNNLYNKYTSKIGKYIDGNDGVERDVTIPGVFYSSDYIYVKDLKIISRVFNDTTKSFFAFYDEDRQYIENINNFITMNLVVPENAVYFRITVNDNNNYVNEGGYLKYENYLTNNNEDIDYINKCNINRIENPNSIYNPENVIPGFYEESLTEGKTAIKEIIDTSGVYYGITDFISINYNETIYSNYKFAFVSEYDENFKFIKTTFESNRTQFTMTSEKCRYARILLLSEFYKLNYFSKSPDLIYEPPYYTNILPNSLDKNVIKNLNETSLNGKIITFIGDSITYGFDGGNPNNRVNNPYPKIIGEVNECITYNLGVNGSTISGSGVGDKQGYQPINVRFGNIDDASDYIILFAGTNDFGSTDSPQLIGNIDDNTNETFYGSLNIIFEEYYNTYIDSKIGVILPLQRINMNNANSSGFVLSDYVDALVNTCKKYSIKYLNLLNESNIYAFNENCINHFLPDGLHPNQDEYYKLANIISKFIEEL